jgi:hypothetical protein
MCRPRTKCAARAIAAAGLLGTLFTGCSNPGLYLDRRDTVAFGAGDAVAANAAEQTVDPWPAQSGNTHIAADGQKMQSAVERYRFNKVIPPIDLMPVVSNQSPAATPQTAGSQNSATTATGAPSVSPTAPTAAGSPNL